MLITNFAAGELSETLYGRTDLPQYYQGASRLENFDVVPTGGIRRRQGTRRLDMDMRGRIIPYIVDRENTFLLYILPIDYISGWQQTPEMRVYTREWRLVDTVVWGTQHGPAGFWLLYDQLMEAQYVQIPDRLIIVHELMEPVVVRLTKESEGWKASDRKSVV
jgi:hypothetical protein